MGKDRGGMLVVISAFGKNRGVLTPAAGFTTVVDGLTTVASEFIALVAGLSIVTAGLITVAAGFIAVVAGLSIIVAAGFPVACCSSSRFTNGSPIFWSVCCCSSVLMFAMLRKGLCWTDIDCFRL